MNIINDRDRIYHDNGNYSDSNCNISSSICDKDNNNENNNNSPNNVYVHNNQRTKQNYYYQRKPITTNNNKNNNNQNGNGNGNGNNKELLSSSSSSSLPSLNNKNNKNPEEKELELDDKENKYHHHQPQPTHIVVNGISKENINPYSLNNHQHHQQQHHHQQQQQQTNNLIYKPLCNSTNKMNVIDSTQFESSLRHRRSINNCNNNNNTFINNNNNNNNNNQYGMNMNMYYTNNNNNNYYMNSMNNNNNNNNNNKPIMVNMSFLTNQQLDGECFVCIDVECAATGYGHFDSSPCRIALVNFFGEIIFDEICDVPNIIDPLTEFTGLTLWDINKYGKNLQYVLNQLHQILLKLQKQYTFGVTIIGQSVVMDLIWTQLKQGIHYERTIDIAHLFKTQRNKWSKFTYYPLREVAWCLLENDGKMNDNYHDPTEDARITIRLYRDFCLNQQMLDAAKSKLKRMRDRHFKQIPNFKKYTKFQQCSAMYSPSKCHCGQTTAADCNGVQDINKLRKLYILHQSKPIKQPPLKLILQQQQQLQQQNINNNNNNQIPHSYNPYC